MQASGDYGCGVGMAYLLHTIMSPGELSMIALIQQTFFH